MPTVRRKSDSDDIREFLRQLEGEDWIRRTERSWWPRYVFHFTDIRNAVEILNGGQLCSRRYLEKHGVKFVDSASPEIIGGTQDDVKDEVRLYFRPRTPTQFRMEGIRPKDRWWKGAHCPVPIFFLFDAADILTRLDCEFTDGNLAGRLLPKRGSTAEFLKSLPFKRIYHTGWYDTQTQSTIKFHRNAEVIVPARLDLSALGLIVCRSPAEKDSLLSLLSSGPAAKYRDKIRVASRARLHLKKWTFVEKVTLTSSRMDIYFSPDSETPGPFLARFQLDNLETGGKDVKEIAGFNVSQYSNPFVIDLPLGQIHYRFTLELDGQLAYQNEYKEIPF